MKRPLSSLGLGIAAVISLGAIGGLAVGQDRGAGANSAGRTVRRREPWHRPRSAKRRPRWRRTGRDRRRPWRRHAGSDARAPHHALEGTGPHGLHSTVDGAGTDPGQRAHRQRGSRPSARNTSRISSPSSRATATRSASTARSSPGTPRRRAATTSTSFTSPAPAQAVGQRAVLGRHGRQLPRRGEGRAAGVGSNAASVWWVNGKEVVALYGDRQTVIDDGVSRRLTLSKGPNVVRGAVINGFGATDFCAGSSTRRTSRSPRSRSPLKRQPRATAAGASQKDQP